MTRKLLLKGNDFITEEVERTAGPTETRFGEKLVEVEVSPETRDELITTSEPTEMRLSIESGEEGKNLDVAESLIASFTGPREKVLVLVELLLTLLQEYGGGVSDVRAFKADSSGA